MRPNRLLRHGTRAGLAALACVVTAIDLYLVALLVAAARRPARRGASDGREHEPLGVTVLVPAHNEEAMIGSTVWALRRMVAPTGGASVVVIADNCSDATAQVATRAGAMVLERREPDRQGKGFALNWALDRLGDLTGSHDVIAVVDADCQPSANLLTSFEAHLADGASAVQASYTVANPGASIHSSLRFAAFALMNTVRPLGKDRLGLSCGLLGTGMAFRREVLQRQRFAGESVVEDADLHLRLVSAGERVVFAREASVNSPMPLTGRASRAQQTRWEGGRIDLLRTWSGPLLALGLRRRDPVRLHAWAEMLVPPQSLLALLHGALGALAFAARFRGAQRIAVLDALLQTAFVLGGLRLTRAPAPVYRALLRTPGLVVQKVGIFRGLAACGAPRTWERTERDTMPER